MKKLQSVFLPTIIALMTTQAQTQNNNLTVTIEPVYMSIYNDLRAGDLYTFYVTRLHIPPDGPHPGEYTLRYGTRYDPIYLSMPHKPTLVWEIQHKADKWGVGIRGWELKNAAYEGNTIYQSDTKQNEDGSTSAFASGFRMLNYTFLPFNGDLPIDWWAENRLRLWSREMYAFKTFSPSLNMRFGIKLVEIFNTLGIGQRHWTSESTNKTYAMSSEIDYLVLGPNLGIDVHTKRIDVFIQQAVLFGTALHTGDWDVGYYKTEYGEERIDPAQKRYSAYNVPLNTHSEEIIPATEINIKLAILKKQLSNNRSIKFGASLFSAAFWWAPIAPRWSIWPSNWYKKRQDILIFGTAIYAKFEF